MTNIEIINWLRAIIVDLTCQQENGLVSVDKVIEAVNEIIWKIENN